MMSQIPFDLKKIKNEGINMRILRAAMISELDAVNLYEQFAAITDSKLVRKVLLDIAREEKTHIGEFQALLLKEDLEQDTEMEKGKKEVQELIEE